MKMKCRKVETVRTIGLDISKNVFQLHCVDAGGNVMLKRQLRRAEVVRFFAELPMCLVGIEACAGAHACARELIELGHDIRLMPPSYVKPYVRRKKTDAADAAAICEAVTRPSMRFVPVKSEAHQAVLLQHRTRDLLVRQMTQTVNAIRAHLAEFGVVAPLRVQNVDQLLETAAQSVPHHAMEAIDVLARQFSETRARVDEITRRIEQAQKEDPTARRLTSIPGVGAITASAITATTPNVKQFRTARDCAAWMGLTPRQHSSGGCEQMGGISKMGDRYLRKLLYLGALARIRLRRRRGEGDDWIWRLHERKPAKVAAIAIANKMARTIWALLRTGQSYWAAL
jgi:transposase